MPMLLFLVGTMLTLAGLVCVTYPIAKIKIPTRKRALLVLLVGLVISIAESALISFVFNLGPTHFRSSTLRKRINEGDFDDVPNQLLPWVYGGGRT